MAVAAILSFLWAVVVDTCCRRPPPGVPHAVYDDSEDGAARELAVDVRGALVQVLAATLRRRLCHCRCGSRTPVVPRGLTMSREWRHVRLDVAALEAHNAVLATGTERATDAASQLSTLSSGLHALLMPTIIALVADPTFPFDLLGSVHMRSTVACASTAAALAALAAREPLTVRAEWRGAEQCNPHARGTVATISVSLRRPGSDAALWHTDASMLFFHPTPRGAAPRAVAADDIDRSHAMGSKTLSLAVGRSWCALSGDYNPIHVYVTPRRGGSVASIATPHRSAPTHPTATNYCCRHPLAAAALGFHGGVVAHGMSVLHAALAPLQEAWRPHGAGADASMALEVNFVRPTFLPTTITTYSPGWLTVPRGVELGGAAQRADFSVVSLGSRRSSSSDAGVLAKPTITGSVTLTPLSAAASYYMPVCD
mgnify:CR=1 FL=1